MKKIAILSVLMFVTIALLLTGCGGGGSSSTPVEKDVVGITSTLNEFMAAARARDQVKMESLLTAPSENYLIIKDFGADLNDPDDNVAHSFFVSPDYISQPSEDIAFVKASYLLHSGEYLWLEFSMVRDQGRWMIDDIEMSVEPGSDSPPIVSPEFVASSYYQLKSDIHKVFSIEDSVGNASTSRQISGYGDGFLEDGITFYEVFEDILEPGSGDYEGFVPAKSRRSLHGALLGSIQSSGLSLRAQTDPIRATGSTVYYGMDSQGAFWLKTYDSNGLVLINNGDPIKIFEPSHAYGEKRVISVPWQVSAFHHNATITIDIGFPVSGFATPLRTYTAVPVTFTTVVDVPSGDSGKWVGYFVSGVGEVAYDGYESIGDSQPVTRNRLLTRYSSDGVLNERNDPIITTGTSLGSYLPGQAITPVQFAQTGGYAPFLYRMYSGTLPADLILTDTGLLSGNIAAGAATGQQFFAIEVVDKYGRHSNKEFVIDIVAPAPIGVITFSPALSTVDFETALESFILFEGTSGLFDNYDFEVLEVAPAGAVSYITPYKEVSESNVAKISIWGYQAGVTINFKLKATHRSSGAVLLSDLQTVVVGP